MGYLARLPPGGCTCPGATFRTMGGRPRPNREQPPHLLAQCHDYGDDGPNNRQHHHDGLVKSLVHGLSLQPTYN